MGQLTQTHDELQATIDNVGDDAVVIFGYLPDGSDTIVLGTAGSWYEGGYSLTYTKLMGASEGTVGIVFTDACCVQLQHRICFKANKTALVQMAIVKNATFTNGILDDEAAILLGSCASLQADIVGQTEGYGTMHSVWAGDIDDGDELTVVFKSSIVSTTLTPSTASLFSQSLLGV